MRVFSALRLQGWYTIARITYLCFRRRDSRLGLSSGTQVGRTGRRPQAGPVAKTPHSRRDTHSPPRRAADSRSAHHSPLSRFCYRSTTLTPTARLPDELKRRSSRRAPVAPAYPTMDPVRQCSSRTIPARVPSLAILSASRTPGPSQSSSRTRQKLQYGGAGKLHKAEVIAGEHPRLRSHLDLPE